MGPSPLGRLLERALSRRRDGGAIEFGERLLALLDRGSFTATYKYAVLLALIDLCLEDSDRHGDPPSMVTTEQLAEKVIDLYWPHLRPFEGGDETVLRQNQGSQAAILRSLQRFRASCLRDPSLPLVKARAQAPAAWKQLLRDIEWKLVEMPLPRLQVLGSGEERFIYQVNWTRETITRRHFNNPNEFDNRILFIGDAAHHLVALAGLLRPLLQREWTAMVARLNDLPESRLESFLFRTMRTPPQRLRADLGRLQEGRCFYCRSGLTATPQVDHFVPWSRHPDDAIENLVLAHAGCNRVKSDHLAASRHVEHWRRRLERRADELAALAERAGWESDRRGVLGGARGIYLNLAPAVPLWVQEKNFESAEPRALQALLN